MARLLILFAHPALEKSRVHRRLLRSLPDRPGITLHDLYEEYPDFAIDVRREQALLLEHDLIILQHPLFWYSAPAIVKQWVDLVLEHGWAYGSAGRALRGKRLLSLISTGGTAAAYRADGLNRFTMRELLRPFEQTARMCGMEYLPPYLIHGVHRMEAPAIAAEATRYQRLLALLHDDAVAPAALAGHDYLHEALADQLGAGVAA